MNAILLRDVGRVEEAAQAAARALYLDSSLAVVHFVLGGLLQQLDDLPGALRAFRNAHDLSVNQPTEAPLPLAEGEHVGCLARASQLHVELLTKDRATLPKDVC